MLPFVNIDIEKDTYVEEFIGVYEINHFASGQKKKSRWLDRDRI